MNALGLKLPPGPSYIVSQLLSWRAVGYVLFVASVRSGANAVGVYTPVWAIIASSAIAIPAALYVQSGLRYWRDKRTAAALGARLAPKVSGKKPLGLDLVAAMLEGHESGYIGDRIADWTSEFGQTIDLRYMGSSHVFTLEPHYIKIVLSTGFEDYEKGEAFRDSYRSLFGTGVFGSDGEMWKFHRSMTRPFFSRDRIGDFEIFDRHADLVISKLKERFSHGISVNAQDLLSRYTMDTATEFLFGQDVKSLSAGLPYPSTYTGSIPPRDHPSDKFTHAFNQAQQCAFPRGLFASAWRLLEFWEDTVWTQMEITNQFIDPLIHVALQKKRDAKGVYEVNMDDSTFFFFFFSLPI